MIQSEIPVLSHAHQMFAGSTWHPALDAGTAHYRSLMRRAAELNDGWAHGGYRLAVDHSRQRLQSAARTDAAAAGVIASAHRDRAQAHELTKNVLDEARADATRDPGDADGPARSDAPPRGATARERSHVLAARLRARRRQAELRALRYNMLRHRGSVLGGPLFRRRTSRRDRGARRAVTTRAALCLGRDRARPVRLFGTGSVVVCAGGYSLGPHHLSANQRWDPSPPFTVRPGDLVFPQAGYVQLAIGDNLVVEAPYSGASVRIVPLGNNVAIRRPAMRSNDWRPDMGSTNRLNRCRNKPDLR